MKKRYLKKEIEIVLSSILCVMFIITCMVDSIELTTKMGVIAIVWFTIMLVLYKILKKYGKGVIYE